MKGAGPMWVEWGALHCGQMLPGAYMGLDLPDLPLFQERQEIHIFKECEIT